MANIGFVGVGNITRFHFAGLKETSARVAAVCDIDEARGRKAAEENSAKYFRDYRKMLESDEVDCVIVALPNHLHHECCLAALEHGKAVFCEKPLTTDVGDSLGLVKVAEERGAFFQVGYMKRFHPGFRALKDFVPRLGTLEFVNVHLYMSGPPPEEMSEWKVRNWLHDADKSGGGVIVHSGSHLLDLLRFCLGDVEQVRAQVRYMPDGKWDCYLNAQLEMSGEVRVQFQIGSVDVPNMGPGMSIVRGGWDECVELVGTKGMVRVENPTWQGLKPARVTTWLQGEAGPTTKWVDSHQQWVDEMKALVNGIEEGKVRGATVRDGYKVDQAIEAIYASARENKTVALTEGGA